MKRAKKFIIYFPVILVICQVLIGIWALISRSSYDAAGFYLGAFFGTNILFAVFLAAFTWSFNFCQVSRFSAIAEVLFAVNFTIVKQDNLYNILFQVIVGIVAIALTYNYFVRKFPLCRISLLGKFIAALFLTGNCQQAVDNFDSIVKESLVKKMYPNGQHNKQHT